MNNNLFFFFQLVSSRLFWSARVEKIRNGSFLLGRLIYTQISWQFDFGLQRSKWCLNSWGRVVKQLLGKKILPAAPILINDNGYSLMLLHLSRVGTFNRKSQTAGTATDLKKHLA